jgi:Ran GTPase-activating protein (RanGAP) involved in mRNA processing and transport
MIEPEPILDAAMHRIVSLPEAISSLSRNSSSLTSLDLASDEIGANGARALAAALRVNSTLSSLNLRSNDIEDDGARALAAALQDNSSLTSLNLGSNDIADDGGRALAAALQVNSSLTSLDLEENAIGDDGAQALATALRVNSTFTYLDLDDNEREDEFQYLLKLNRSGLRNLVKNESAKPKEILAAVERECDDLNHLFFLLRNIPTIMKDILGGLWSSRLVSCL